MTTTEIADIFARLDELSEFAKQYRSDDQMRRTLTLGLEEVYHRQDEMAGQVHALANSFDSLRALILRALHLAESPPSKGPDEDTDPAIPTPRNT